MEEEKLLTLTNEEQHTLSDIAQDAHKHHTLAVWRTRIIVSMITAIVVSALVSFGSTLVITHNERGNLQFNSSKNCHSIQRLKDADMSVLQRARQLTVDASEKHPPATLLEKEQLKINVDFYNQTLAIYSKVTPCNVLR